MSRLPPLEPARLAPDQRRVYDAIASGPRGGVRGPFLALIHVPELTDRIQHLGEYLRYGTSFPPRLSELAILVTARHYTCNYEWQAHVRHARRGGTGRADRLLHHDRDDAARARSGVAAGHGAAAEVIRPTPCNCHL